MDDALLKAVQASEIALHQLTEHGVDFKDSKVKKALSDLEKLEDEFLKTVRESASAAGKPMRTQWTAVLEQIQPGGTGTGAQAEAVIDSFTEQMRTAARRQREAGLKATHLLTQNFATLASGVLIGMSEALQRSTETAAKDRGA
jgi:hypothetical protein